MQHEELKKERTSLPNMSLISLSVVLVSSTMSCSMAAVIVAGSVTCASFVRMYATPKLHTLQGDVIEKGWEWYHAVNLQKEIMLHQVKSRKAVSGRAQN